MAQLEREQQHRHPLHAAVALRGSTAGLKLQRLLAAREVGVNSPGPLGLSALGLAACLGRADLCSMLLVAGADPERQPPPQGLHQIDVMAALEQLLPVDQAVAACSSLKVHNVLVMCIQRGRATPLDLAISLDDYAVAERLAAASMPTALTRALATWASAPPGSLRFALVLLLLREGADAYAGAGGDSGWPSFLQRMCAVPLGLTAMPPEQRRDLCFLYSQLLHTDSVGPSMRLSGGRLGQLLLAALEVGAEPDCVRLLGRLDLMGAHLGDHSAHAKLLCKAASCGFAGAVAAMLGAPLADFSPSMEWRGASALIYAAKVPSDQATMAVLLDAGANVDSSEQDTGMTALHYGVLRGQLESVQLLLSRGASPQPEEEAEAWACGDNMETPLMSAIYLRRWEVAEVLLQAGAPVNDITDYSRSPLCAAIFSENPAIVERLIRLGADVNKVPGDGSSYNLDSLSDGEVSESFTLLEGACYAEDAKDMVELLLREGADPAVGEPEGSWCALLTAASIPCPPAIAAILRHCADRGISLAQLAWQQAVLAATCCSVEEGEREQELQRMLGQLLEAGRRSGCGMAAEDAANVHRAMAAHAVMGSFDMDQVARRAQLLASYGIHSVLDEATLPSVQEALWGSVGRARALFMLAGLPAEQRWSQELHRYHPPAFQAAVRQLLLASSRPCQECTLQQPRQRRQRGKRPLQHKRQQQSFQWHLLPGDVLLRVLSFCGSDVACWLQGAT